MTSFYDYISVTFLFSFRIFIFVCVFSFVLCTVRKAREARIRASVASNSTGTNATRNATTNHPPTLENERETLVRLLKQAMHDVLIAPNATVRKPASIRAADLQIRLDELDELVAARADVANATEKRASAGSTGNSTLIERADVLVQHALTRLSRVLARQRERRFPTKMVVQNHTEFELLFMTKCLGNDTQIGLNNATKLVYNVPTTHSIHMLVVAKNAARTKKRVCRLKLQIKTAMKMLQKTTDEEDRSDIKSEIKTLAHKISMILRSNTVKEKHILYVLLWWGTFFSSLSFFSLVFFLSLQNLFFLIFSPDHRLGATHHNATSNTTNRTENRGVSLALQHMGARNAPVAFNESTVAEAVQIAVKLKKEANKVLEIKHLLQAMNVNSTSPDVKMMTSIVEVTKQAKASFARVNDMLKEQMRALASTNPLELDKIAIIKKNIEKSKIAVKSAAKNSDEITRYMQDSAMAAVREAKAEVESNVFDTKAAQLGVDVVAPKR